MLSTLGFLLFLIGAGGMDNQDVTIPTIMILSGMVFILLEVIRERIKDYRICNWKNSRKLKQQERFVIGAFYIKDMEVVYILKILKYGKQKPVTNKCQKDIKKKGEKYGLHVVRRNGFNK